MLKFFRFLRIISAIIAISPLVHANEVALSQADKSDISRIVVEKKIAILDRNGKPIIRKIIVALLVDGKRALPIEEALSKELPILFISKERQVSKDHCWIDSQTGKSLMGIDIGPLIPNKDGSVSVESGSSTCVMGTESTTYTFRRVNRKWALAKESRDMII